MVVFDAWTFAEYDGAYEESATDQKTDESGSL